MSRFLKRLTTSIQKRFFKTDFDRTYDRWVAARGDQTLRLDYPLSASSVVFDLGGYKGDWAQEIFDRFGCQVWIFEPVPSFAQGIRRRFHDHDKIKVFEFGLAASDGSVELNLAENSSSQFSSKGGATTTIRLSDVGSFFSSHAISKIDLMKINIEGAEYDLLDSMLDRGLSDRITDLQIQFHDFFLQAAARREKIRSRLARTHQVTYDFPFIWENWQRRS